MPFFRAILIADDEASIRHVLTLVLVEKGYEVRAVSDGEEAQKELAARPYDVLLTDIRMPKVGGLELIEKAHGAYPELLILAMSAYGSQDAALEAVGKGAYDYVQKPFKPEEVVLALRKAEERARLLRENRRLKGPPPGKTPLERLVGNSEGLKALRRQIERLARVNTTILVTGESGTGKELVALALHELSPRVAMPFVPVNCGAIPAGLIESELFGHAKGAFTDARTAKRGLFSEADGGTLFLDEVGELPLAAQTKLLRFLQEGEIRPVGENKSETVDVRVVGATHRDLQKLVEKGEFREDLYYRLNVVNLRVPPLRERKDDVVILAGAFLNRFNRELNRELSGYSEEAMAVMTGYGWPGNVRELENAVERAVLLSEGTEITPENLPERIWMKPATPENRPQSSALPSTTGQDLSLKRAMRELEESFIRAALRRTKGNRTRAAELLEISHRALLYKIKEYGVDADAEGEKG